MHTWLWGNDSVIQGKVEEIDLGDVKEVDVIVSEWMVSFRLYLLYSAS